MTTPVRLASTPFHLGLGATAEPLDGFDSSPAWYGRYSEMTAGDGAEGRLVSMHTFTENWDGWEMHPSGHELVVCTAGEIELVQERDGVLSTVRLSEGEAAVNEPGVWHTANIAGTATVLFITAGMGTQARPREAGE